MCGWCEERCCIQQDAGIERQPVTNQQRKKQIQLVLPVALSVLFSFFVVSFCKYIRNQHTHTHGSACYRATNI